jgi:hypothetical protein
LCAACAVALCVALLHAAPAAAQPAPTPARGLGSRVNPTPAAAVTSAVTSAVSSTVTAAPVGGALDATLDAAYAGIIEGTVVANRTQSAVRFFVEGELFDLDPLRSTGVTLPRETAVLNLFNCDATMAASAECFWDPYLLNSGGFYEVITGEEAGAAVSLSLREAGTPPGNQVWVHNRTGRREQVYVDTQMVELPPATVHQFDVPATGIAVLYLRTCVEGATSAGAGTGPVCEWAAHNAQPGSYYALVEDTYTNSATGATVADLQLEPVLGAAVETVTTVAPEVAASAGTTGTAGTGAAAPAPAAPAAAGRVICRPLVPALNVRSGPGLSFDVMEKVMADAPDGGMVIVVGRSDTSEWLQVDERVAANGWIIADPNFITCEGDTAALPVTATAPPTPTPAPIVETEPLSPTGEIPPADAGAPVTDTAPAAPAGPAVPAGQAVLVVNNGFDWPIRFTLDQRYRVELGPSEYDLNPGESVTLVVWPGQLAFSASSPWNELSGMTEMTMAEDEARTLWVTFIPDPGEPGNWVMMY